MLDLGFFSWTTSETAKTAVDRRRVRGELGLVRRSLWVEAGKEEMGVVLRGLNRALWGDMLLLLLVVVVVVLKLRGRGCMILVAAADIAGVISDAECIFYVFMEEGNERERERY